MRLNSFFLVFMLILSAIVFKIFFYKEHLKRINYIEKKKYLEKLTLSADALLLIGNSIIEKNNWIGLKERSYKIINLGISGEKINQLTERIDYYLEKKYNYLVIEIGINDVLSNANFEEILLSFDKLTDKVSKNKRRILILSLAPLGKNRQIDFSIIKKINEKVVTFCNKKGITFVDIFTPLVDENNYMNKKFSDDGLHPNIYGYKIIENQIMDSIIKE